MATKRRRPLREADFGLNLEKTAAWPAAGSTPGRRGLPNRNGTKHPMTFIEADAAPSRKSGHIRLHGPEGFEGMRKAGRLAAEALDLMTEAAQPGVTTDALDKLAYRIRHGSRRLSGAARLSRLSQVDLHVDQPCRLPRHPGFQAAAGRRHRQHRRHLHPGRLAWRFEPHVFDRRGSPQGAAAGRGDLRVAAARHRRRQAGRHHRRYRPCDPDLCRSGALLRGARVLRPRPRTAVPRRAQHPALRPEGPGRDAARGHVLHHRADDQSRQAAGEDPRRRLDRRDSRPFALGAVRACDRRHRRGLRDLHLVAAGPDTARPTRPLPPDPERMLGPAADEELAQRRPSRAPARALPAGRRRRPARLRTARTAAVPRHSPARRQADRQDAAAALRLVRRSHRRARRRG